MAILEYQRFDLALTVWEIGWSLDWDERLLGGLGHSSVSFGRPQSAAEIYRDVVREVESLERALAQQMSGAPETSISRLVIRTEARLAGFSWENLSERLWDLVVVRASDARLRAAELPLTTPLRILQCDPRQLRVAEVAHDVFSPTGLGDRWHRAVTVEELALDDVARFQRESAWPTVEILHLTVLPGAGAELLAVGRPDLPGSVGWLERILSLWQTRLVVLEAEDAAQAELGRRLGASLTSRGGPAVLVLEAGPDPALYWLRAFYYAVFHDRPLDWALRESTRSSPLFRHGGSATLFAGGGREEALRIGNVARELAALVQRIDERREDAREIQEQVEHQIRRWNVTRTVHRLRPRTGVVATVRKVLNTRVFKRLDRFHFEDSERGGFVPVVKVLDRLRVGSLFEEPIRPQGPPILPEDRAEEPRFVNARLQAAAGEDRVREVPQRGEALRPDWYFLAIDIGLRPDALRAARATAVLNEVLLFDPETEGRWVEVAVSGIDFTVASSPVQQLWVPARGPSQAAVFTVRPRKPGVNVLRFTVYADQNLVQSFKLAAFVAVESPEAATYSAEEMAAVLDLGTSEVEERVWLSRLEYGTDVPSIQSVERRKVSIVSNELRKEWVITVKSAETFSVRVRSDLEDDVADVRDALDLASVLEPENAADREDWPYAFDDQTNSGTDERLEENLVALAELGWKLFTKLIPNADRPYLLEDLGEDEQVIKVAHLLIEKVIPWSVIYDRELYPDRGGAVLCKAALPNADGDWPAVRCGEAPCLLADGRSPSSVVCPRHFWGFRHRIELPVQQIGRGGVTRPPQKKIKAPKLPRVSFGLHGGLSHTAGHLKDLRDLQPENGRSLDVVSEGFDAGCIVENLKDKDLDLVYFYCHAEGGKDSGPPTDPTLRFRSLPDPPPQGPETHAEAEDFSNGPMYEHYPLVILNGCRTAAFRPDTLSGFITSLVEDRWASGVLGTEISVFEQLATEVGLEFLRLFLGDESAGAALARVRRRLLAKRNPLGLVYTLYADAELELKKHSE